MSIEEIKQSQEDLCRKYSAAYREVALDDFIGVSDNLGGKDRPLHGLRHSATDTTTGWYIWAGDYKDDDDFFKPVHVRHLIEQMPELSQYLGLAPGWRFLIDPEHGHEDVWQDKSLIL